MAPRFPLPTRLLVSSATSASSASPSPAVASSSSSTSSRPFASCSRPSSPTLRARSSFQKRAFHASGSKPAPKDPYQVLGVDSKASANDIKKTYYQLAKQFHPDQNKEKGAKEKFIDIQAAYDTLSDEKKRAAYDSYGSASQDPNFDPSFANGGGFGAGGFSFGGDAGFGGGMGGGPTGDLFSSLFGGAFGGSRQARPLRGDDIEAAVTIDFLEACAGVSRTVQTTPVVECGTCKGTGMKEKAKKETCRTCRGSGQRTFVIQSGFQMQSTCNDCGGSGSKIPLGKECTPCGGVGRVREKRPQKFDIPPGIEDQMLLRLDKSGDLPLQGSGPAGDLLVRVNVLPSRDFRRQGTNLYHTAKIPVHLAMLGGQTSVPTLEGNVEIKVRGGTQQGAQNVLPGRGTHNAQNRKAKRGDLIIEYALEVPKLLTSDQRTILEAYADTMRPDYVTPSKPFQFSSASSTKPSTASSSATASPSSSSTASPSSGSSSPPRPPPIEPEEPKRGWLESSLGRLADWLDPPSKK